MKRRPINLNFLTLRFPITAWVSIAHRLSGVLLFFSIPLILWYFQASLSSEASFSKINIFFHDPVVKIGLSVFISALCYHLVAGIRHLLLDIHIGESKSGGRKGAKLVIVLFVAFLPAIGYWLW